MELRLLLWMYLLSALYSIALHVRRRAALGRRYLVVLAIMALLSAAGLHYGRYELPAFWGATILFGVFMLLPGLLVRAARSRARKADFSGANRLIRIARLALPARLLDSEATLYRALDEAGGAAHPAGAAFLSRANAGSTRLGLFSARGTVALALILTAVHLAIGILGDSESVYTLLVAGANCGPLVAAGDIPRLLTAMFLHIGWLHLVLNVGAIWMIGRWIEPRLGAAYTFAVFFLAGLAGNLGSFLLYREDGVISAGASGGAMGLVGVAAALSFSRKQDDVLSHRRSALMLVIGATLLVGFIEPGIDNGAHIGGLAVGLVLGAAWLRGLAPRPVAARAMATVFVAACVAAGGWIIVKAPAWEADVALEAPAFRLDHPAFLSVEGGEGDWHLTGRPEVLGEISVELVEDLGDTDALALSRLLALTAGPRGECSAAETPPPLRGTKRAAVSAASAVRPGGFQSEVYVLAEPGTLRGVVLSFSLPHPDEVLRERVLVPVLESFRFR